MSQVSVDSELIERLAALLEQTGLTEIELAEGDSRIRVAKAPPTAIATVAGVASAPAAVAPATGAEPEASSGDSVNSPMVGTAYLAPEPGAAPFVTVGSRVEEGQTLLIIEAMKVMNPIRAPRSGTITAVLVKNATPVEYGEPLVVMG